MTDETAKGNNIYCLLQNAFYSPQSAKYLDERDKRIQRKSLDIHSLIVSEHDLDLIKSLHIYAESSSVKNV